MITAEDVINGYRYILGRDPESPEIIEMYLRQVSTVDELRCALLNSEEFVFKNKYIKFNKSKWVCTNVLGGLLIWVDLSDRYVSYGCLHDNYEPNETAFVRNHVRAGMNVLDIGANIGWYTLLMQQIVGKDGLVISFEPRYDIYNYLCKTIVYNNILGNVRIHNLALADEMAKMYISYHRHTDNPGGSYLSSVMSVDGDMISVPVHTDSLDSLYPDINIDFIKVDVEGAEFLVFKGAMGLLKRCRPIIMSEIHPEQLERVSGCTPKEYINFMYKYGYSCYEIINGEAGKRLTDYNGDGNPINVCFLP